MAKATHELYAQHTTCIAGVCEKGLTLSHGPTCRFFSWARVSSVMGGVSKDDGLIVFVAIGIDDDYDGERILLVSERDSIWADLVKILHLGLPVAPLDAWAKGIAAFPGAYTLYERPAKSQ